MDPKRAIRPLKPLQALIFASRWLQLPLYFGLVVLWQTVIHVVFLASAVAIALIDRMLQVPGGRVPDGTGAH